MVRIIFYRICGCNLLEVFEKLVELKWPTKCLRSWCCFQTRTPAGPRLPLGEPESCGELSSEVRLNGELQYSYGRSSLHSYFSRNRTITSYNQISLFLHRMAHLVGPTTKHCAHGPPLANLLSLPTSLRAAAYISARARWQSSSSKKHPRTALFFPGQGVQRVGMVRSNTYPY